MVATANGPYGYYRQGVGWRMLRNGLQFKLFGSGPILSRGRRGRRLRQSGRPLRAEPTIQAFCVPIVYLDRDTLGTRPGRLWRDGHDGGRQAEVARLCSARGRPIRTKCRSFRRNLLNDPADMQAMIEGQRFFLRAFQTSPLKERIARIGIPDPTTSATQALDRTLPAVRENQLSSERNLPDGRAATIRWRCWTRDCACGAWSVCAYAISPRCPTSTPATPTRPL